jgi:hypothetical protein
VGLCVTNFKAVQQQSTMQGRVTETQNGDHGLILGNKPDRANAELKWRAGIGASVKW